MSDEVKLKRPIHDSYTQDRPKALVKKPQKASVEKMMADVYGILNQQIERLRIRSVSYSLEKDEVSNLRDYARCLIDISKEEREMLKAEAELEKLKDLSLEELVELAKKKSE